MLVNEEGNDDVIWIPARLDFYYSLRDDRKFVTLLLTPSKY